MDLAVYSAIKDLDNNNLGRVKQINATVTSLAPFYLQSGVDFKRISIQNDSKYSNLQITLGSETNLFNRDTFNSGFYVSENGQLFNDSRYNASDYIEVGGGVKYTRNNTMIMAFYDSNKAFISFSKDSKEVVSPTNAKYIRFSFNATDNLDNVFFKKYLELSSRTVINCKPNETITLDSIVNDIAIFTDFAPCDIKILLNGVIKSSREICHDSKFTILNKVVFHAKGNFIIASSLDRKILQFSQDMGVTWTDVITETTTTFVNAHIGNGYIVVFDSVGGIRVTENNGTNWTNATTGNISGFRPPFYHGIDSFGNTVIFAEYDTVVGNYNVFKSTDKGKTWSVVLTKANPSEIRHFHSVNYNQNIGKWIVTSGDNNNNVRWFMSTDGTTWTEVDGVQSQRYRTLNVYDCSYDEIMWTSDCQSGTRGEILKANINDIKNTTKIVTSLNGTGWGLIGCGSDIISVTAVEEDDMLNRQPSIYLSKDAGQTWNCIMRNKLKSGKTYGGFKSVLGILTDGSFVVGVNYLDGIIDNGYYGCSIIVTP